jgi:hypothetical protein
MPGTSYVILCEDEAQATFARRFLIGRGANRHKFHVQRARPGEGSGEQYVRENAGKYVRGFRSKSRGGQALIIMIDADRYSVDERLEHICKSIDDAGVVEVSEKARIGIFIPRRNIETWIAYIAEPSRTDINEIDDYRYPVPKQWEKTVETYARERKPLPASAPPSLRRACDEWPKIAPRT